MKNIKMLIGLVTVLLIAIALSAMSSYADTVNEDIAGNVIRLHVVANSDSAEDQELKYAVRDSLLEYMQENLSQAGTGNRDNSGTVDGHKKAEVNGALLGTLENIANGKIKSEGYDYEARVAYGLFPFPTKTYGDVAFPAGYYNAVKVEIGNSSGKNWWCVMFPPLCMVDAVNGKLTSESKEMLRDSMSAEDYAIVTLDDDSPGEIKVKFKIVEIFQSLKIRMDKMFD